MECLIVLGFTADMTNEPTTSTITTTRPQPSAPAARPAPAPTDHRDGRPVLLLGGTGKTGRRIAARLDALGVPFRVASRRATPRFDWDDPDTWPPVLDGVGAAYLAYYPDLAFPGAAETIGAFARQAVDRGVERLVLLSGRGEPEAEPAEDAVRTAGAAWTVLRASWFSQDFSEHFLLDPVLAGTIALPAGDVAEPFVDATDIADVAVAALLEDGHGGRTYELTGPRLITFAEAAEEIGRAAGRDVRYLAVTPEQFAAGAVEAGLPAEEVGPFTDLITRVLDGHNAYLADGVHQALGRPPRDFADYVRETAAAGVWAPPRDAG